MNDGNDVSFEIKETYVMSINIFIWYLCRDCFILKDIYRTYFSALVAADLWCPRAVFASLLTSSYQSCSYCFKRCWRLLEFTWFFFLNFSSLTTLLNLVTEIGVFLIPPRLYLATRSSGRWRGKFITHLFWNVVTFFFFFYQCRLQLYFIILSWSLAI